MQYGAVAWRLTPHHSSRGTLDEAEAEVETTRRPHLGVSGTWMSATISVAQETLQDHLGLYR